ncbi:hypothetical protein L1987_63722 [Smallanthus sonchifolius]|uniref:Uncharacterized protein n=1 Tax=Smallanthus sonchifolius TaxID=185202 RepID=A0ACB9CE24_9ASTR|nr:hypothetical protein L1987_63722 [Smallanthus sonchifolius]
MSASDIPRISAERVLVLCMNIDRKPPTRPVAKPRLHLDTASVARFASVLGNRTRFEKPFVEDEPKVIEVFRAVMIDALNARQEEALVLLTEFIQAWPKRFQRYLVEMFLSVFRLGRNVNLQDAYSSDDLTQIQAREYGPLGKRVIRCGGAVDDDMAADIVAQVLYLDAVDPNKV